ncbi:DNA methyltransferase, partial [candidate division WOR-3 bacterium]|nr:DNA methyltransferase [candidate division WOR-3 bacterium]
MLDPFTTRITEVIKSIPEGRVATYGQIAAMAGDPRATRQVVWVLRSLSEKE